MKTYIVSYDNYKYRQPLNRRDWTVEIAAKDTEELKDKIKMEFKLNPFYLKWKIKQ
jgi:hypothetical protein